MPTDPNNPTFKPTDKIVLDFERYNSTNGTRGRTHQIPIAYVVVGYTPQTGTYYVAQPNQTNIRLYAQFDLENNFRLATPYEQDLYFQ